VKKEGYQPVQTAFASRQGTSRIKSSPSNHWPEPAHLSDPRCGRVHQWRQAIRADSVTLPLLLDNTSCFTPAGYDPFVSSVQVKDNSQTQISTKLNLRSSNTWRGHKSEPILPALKS